MEVAESEKKELRERRGIAPQTGPFVLRSLLEDVPLSAEGNRDDIRINCVEFLGKDLCSLLVPIDCITNT
jgi:hypothetical protein